MSKIAWSIAGAVAAVTTVAVSIKLAVEGEDKFAPPPRKKRESPMARTKRMQAQLRNNAYHNSKSKNRGSAHYGGWG